MSPVMGPPVYGWPMADLHEHLNLEGLVTEGYRHYFVFNDFSSSYVELPPIGVSAVGAIEPSFRVGLESSSETLELWYGWSDVTYHRAHTWHLGRWNQDQTPARLPRLEPEELGRVQQLTNIEAIHRAVERELAALAQRLAGAARFTTYRLEWAEVAMLLADFQQRWNAAVMDQIRSDPWSSDRSDDYGFANLTTSGRQQSLTLAMPELAGGRGDLRLVASLEPSGWRLDTYDSVERAYWGSGDCDWSGAMVFNGDYQGGDYLPCPRCLPARDHRMIPERSAPWGLYDLFMEEDWLPRLIKQMRGYYS